MDIQAYISSGILESYALGLCNGDEAREVEALCRKHPELKKELDHIQLALGSYAGSHARKVPAHLKERIFEEIGVLERNDAPEPFEVKAVRRDMFIRFAMAASIGLFLLSTAFNIMLYNKWREADEQVAALNDEKILLSENLRSNEVKLNVTSNEFAVLSDTATRHIMLKGLARSPQSLAVVYWNKTNNEVYLKVKNLPDPAEGKQYQLWAIVDGKPVDAGMVPLTASGALLIRMKDFASAQMFAITLEKAGGNPTPTLEEMIVAGSPS